MGFFTRTLATIGIDASGAILVRCAMAALCFAVMLILRHVLTKKQIWIASVIGAVFHNIGQIIVAIVVTGTPAIVSYLPVLLLSGIVTGLFTGLAAQYLVHRLERK